MTTPPESKWTKGPWSVETLKTSVGHCHKIAPINACIYVDHRDMRERDEKTVTAAANARLIVLAPDMAEALKLAETTLTRYIRTPPGEGMHEFSAEEMAQIVDAHPTIIAIRTALSKAAGGEPS